MGNENKSPQKDVQTISQNVANYAPEAIQGIYGTLPGAAQQQANADIAYSQAVAPEQLALYSKYAPQFAETGRAISSADAMQAARDEAAIAAGPGQDLVSSALKYQQQFDPEYFKTRELVSGGLQKYIGGMDPNVLTGAEEENIRRSAARAPGAFTPSNQATINRAFTFGDALRQKRADFSTALNTATSALPTLKSGFSGIDIATRRQGGPNSGTQQFTGVQGGQGAGALQLGGQFLNNASQIQLGAQQKRKSLLDNIGQAANIGGQVIGGIASAAAI